MCEAEDQLYEVERENEKLRKQLGEGRHGDFVVLCEAIDDMRRGLATSAEIVDLAHRLAGATERQLPDMRIRVAA